ncbi:MAG: ABC transporter permease [Thermomicrobiales bacterium]|nr:ABC transporter permease [Thermomicrobiales bacterium]
MTHYLVRRLLHAITILIGISVLVFIFVEVAPGDAIDSMLPPESMPTPEAKEAMRERLGLNDPAPVRYVRWLGRAVQGDLGYSLTSRKPVTDIIMVRLPKTLQLVGTAMVISVIVGVSTGIISAIRQYSWIDYLATFLSFFWLSIPGFFLGLMMIYLFAVKLGWFPVFGASTAGAANPILDRLHHLVLPATVLGLELAAALTRYTRASLLEVLKADYMRTARAKGLRERLVIVRHGLKNALIPIITVIAFRMPYLISGAVVIETVFQWPGLGLLTLNAANQKDYPVVLALALAVTLIVVISSFLADVAYSIVDPRIRLG